MFVDSANVPHWYILSYIGTHENATKRLDRIELPSFVPVFFEEKTKKVNMNDFRHFTNYSFIYGTQNDIYALKLTLLSTFNFLHKSNNNDQLHPYVEENVVTQLRRVEEIHGGKIPFMPYPSDVVVGDTVKILTGDFKDHEAKAITKNGSKYRQIILDVAGKFIIPLCQLKVGEYEIIRYSRAVSSSHSLKVKAEDVTFLREALERHYGIKAVDESCISQDKAKIHLILQHYNSGTPETHLQRVKTSLVFVMANTILNNKEEQVHYINHTLNLLQEKCSPSLQASAYCTLYGCTFNEEYFYDYISVRKNAKDDKAFAKINEQITLYRRWNDILFPCTTRPELKCPTADAMWFALELQSPMDDVLAHFEEAGIPTYDPNLTSNSGKRILLAHSTFDVLSSLCSDVSPFIFVHEEKDDHDEPLFFVETDVESYRYVSETMSDDITILPLTPESDALYSKVMKTTVTINGHNLHGIIGTSKIKRTEHRRLIIHLPHLAAIAIPL